MSVGHRVITALDYPRLDQAQLLMERLQGITGSKVGSQLATGAGLPTIVATIGRNIFLDLKYHDIPNTVAEAVKAAARFRIPMLNVHCLGGPKMLKAAVEAARQMKEEIDHSMAIIGVTMLTSHDDAELGAIGIDSRLSMEKQVKRLARMAQDCQLHGVVCSPQETLMVRNICGPQFTIITPGIRGTDEPLGDQKRTATPAEAIQAGADYIVVGRPITQALDPVAAATRIVAEVETELAARGVL